MCRGDMVLPANGVLTHRQMYSQLLWPLTGSPSKSNSCAVDEAPFMLYSLRHARAHDNMSVGLKRGSM